MLEWISENTGNIIVGSIVTALIIIDIIYLVHQRIKGKSSCGCDCGCCSMNGQCNKKK